MKIPLTHLGRCVCVLWLALSAHPGALRAEAVGETIDSFLARVVEVLSPQELVQLEPATALALMSEAERRSLATDYLSFSLDRPGVVHVAFHEHPTGPVFWLHDLGFEPTETRVEIARLHWRLWRKAYPAGPVRLGIPALHAFVPTYFVLVTAGPDGLPAVAQTQPEWAAALSAREGLSVYHDVNFPLPANLPEMLDGSVLIQNSWANRRGFHVVGKYRLTAQPSGPVPDQVVLTWSEDPRFTQTIQWRTRLADDVAQVQYLPREEWMRKQDRPEARAVGSTSTVMEDQTVANDPAVRWHTATLGELEPGTTYVYRIVLGDGRATAPSEFTTAARDVGRFSFVFHGDVQEGFDQWAVLLEQSRRTQPAAAFHLMIGDMVNRGVQREQWDYFWTIGSPVFARTPLLPVIGNHECEGPGGHPSLYLRYLTLPENGPDTIEAQRAYHFTYGDALFVILDSNLGVNLQTEWLRSVLEESRQTWKIVAFHHPVYGSDPRRAAARDWTPWLELFDRYGVDLVLQGHDHSYLRTYPMFAGRRAPAGQRGTVYVTSVAGTKMYATGEYEYAEHALKDTPTWQWVEVDGVAGELRFIAYDHAGEVKDSFTLQKRPRR